MTPIAAPFRTALAGALLLAGTVPAVAGPEPPAAPAVWSHQPEKGYLRAGTSESKTAAELLAFAEERAAARAREEALALFVLLGDTAEDEAVRGKALRRRGDVEFELRRWVACYQSCELYLARYPQAGDLPDVVRRELECARAMAEHGTRERVAGIFSYRTSRPGVDLLRTVLERYPFEEFSDDYHYVLGEVLWRLEDRDGAAVEFELLLKNYPQSEWAPAALFQLAMIALSHFDNIPYDGRPLKEGRRRLRQYLESYPGGPQIELVRRRMKDLDELESKRAFQTAEYYVGQGRTPAARYYFTLIATQFPETFWGSEAALRLKAMGAAE